MCWMQVERKERDALARSARLAGFGSYLTTTFTLQAFDAI